MSTYYTYIMASRSGTLYVGVTGDLARRVFEHKHGLVKGFTRRYRVTRLVHFEATDGADAAIAREKELKGWLRAKKIALVERTNPNWRDLSRPWFAKHRSQNPRQDRQKEITPSNSARDPSLRSG